MDGIDFDAAEIAALDATVADADPSQIEPWGMTAAALSTTVSQLTVAERVAVIETIEAWRRAEGVSEGAALSRAD